MKYGTFLENEWIYHDTPVKGSNEVFLDCARRADACFQILTDLTLEVPAKVEVLFSSNVCHANVFQLIPAHVGENSGPKTHTTKDYEAVRHFVTRRAPFDVFEKTQPFENGCAEAGHIAFFVRVDVPADATPGEYDETLSIAVAGETLLIPVHIRIYHATVPALSDARFHMVNWIYYDRLAADHGVALCSKDYQRVLRAYLENQLDMRNDYLMLPSGEAIRDADGRVIDFDFSHAEYVGNLALSMGFSKIMGGFCVHWRKWDESTVILIWDCSIDAMSLEGYRQLSLYFRRAWECVCKNGWQEQYFQCLEDEPQFENSMEYRVVAAICRKHMPSVQIHDPVESTELGGGPDVWVVKQAIYEKYQTEYELLQSMGEEMWLYTCGFPAGATMNRILDLPLSASLLPMWMCYKYDAKGFLHWGYHLHNPEREGETCYRTGRNDECYPAGNSFVVYPNTDGVCYGIRGHAQRLGAYDYELLSLLGERDRNLALRLVEKLCRSFDDYTADAALIHSVRRELLEALE